MEKFIDQVVDWEVKYQFILYVSRTKINHIVPRSYLSSWARFNRKGELRVLDIKAYDPKKVMQKHARAVCYEKFYYPQIVENFLQQEIETPAADIWTGFLDSEMKGVKREIIARFIAYQALRSKESMDKIMTLIMLGPGRDNVFIPKKLVEGMDPVLVFKKLRSDIECVAELLSQRNWKIIDFKANLCVETSDSPVCIGHDEQKIVHGFLHEEIIIFPMSPCHVLIINQSEPFGYKREEVLPGMAKSINNLVRHWARRYIILPPK